MSTPFHFDDIRPYCDNEAHDVLQKIIKDPLFMKLVNNLWPSMSYEEVQAKAEKVNSNLEFQVEFMHPAIRTIVARSAKELTCSGFEHLDKNEAYLFVANHRDILLDSAILQILLVENGFATSEITFGKNLMEEGFITDFGRLNRMFAVMREGTSRELYDISKKLSAYIRHTLVDKNTSVWIAQRNGRTKDGNDQTQTGLLKMLNISGTGSFAENFAELKIVPLTISYEYEPCDVFKVQELYLSGLLTKYIKAEGEDLNSIITGIIQPKGRIHMKVGTPILNELNEIDTAANENEKIKLLTTLVDKQIYKGYKLWPVNFIAADILNNNITFSAHYTSEEKENFLNYISSKTASIDGEQDVLFNLFIKLYAAPVGNVFKN